MEQKITNTLNDFKSFLHAIKENLQYFDDINKSGNKKHVYKLINDSLQKDL